MILIARWVDGSLVGYFRSGFMYALPVLHSGLASSYDAMYPFGVEGGGGRPGFFEISQSDR